MATAIAVYDKSGNCVRRCDSNCHHAKHEKCVCVCGGANHGKPKKQVRDNTRELADEWINADKFEFGDQFEYRIFDRKVEQIKLL